MGSTKISYLAVIVIALTCLSIHLVASIQMCATVAGHLVCEADSQKAVGVEVWLKDDEGAILEFLNLDQPDIMDHTLTDGQGRFYLSGCASDSDIFFTNHPDPYITFNHTCNVDPDTKTPIVFASAVKKVFHPDALECGGINLDNPKETKCNGQIRKDAVSENSESQPEQQTQTTGGEAGEAGAGEGDNAEGNGEGENEENVEGQQGQQGQQEENGQGEQGQQEEGNAEEGEENAAGA